ncbi:hypothetical protein JW921_04970 [Candidatus Fermentibacterales bacterium]|nr:hypothetical protein [Candidatus Fermentibacterales bacterium]
MASAGHRLRLLARPAALALYFVALAALLTWPMLPRAGHGAYDHADSLFNTWLMAWNHHALLSGSDPMDLPIFLGQPDADGRSDLLLTQAILAIPLRLLGISPLGAHNLILVLSIALCGLSAYLFSRSVGLSVAAAWFAGTAFAATPFFQSHLWHVQLASCGLSVLALAQSVRMALGRGPGPVPSALLLSLLILLQGCASLYYLVFLDIALLLLAVFVALGRMGGPRRLPALAALLCGLLLGNLLMLPLLGNQLSNAVTWCPDTMTSTDLAAFLAPWESSILEGWARPSFLAGEAALWPGLIVVGCLVAWFARLRKKARSSGSAPAMEGFLICLGLLSALVIVGPTVSLGGRGIAPAPWRLLAWIPGFASIRLPGRMGFLFLLPACVIAGATLQRARRFVPWLLGLLAIAEVMHPPLDLIAVRPPPYHDWISARGVESVVILPMFPSFDRPEPECLRLYGSMASFTPMVNGYATSLPRDYPETARILNEWPSAPAERWLDSAGVEAVVTEGFVPPDADRVWMDGRVPAAVVLR